jgi:branched-chain amino acid aminotransferase
MKLAKLWHLENSGELVNLQFIENITDLDTGSRKLPDGVYTTFRTYFQNKVLRLSSHFQRLQTSAELQNCFEKLDLSAIRVGLRKAGEAFSNIDVRYRIHWSLTQPQSEIYILAEPFYKLPDEFYTLGVRVQTVCMERENPVSKSTRFINSTSHFRENKPNDIHEYLMVSSNHEILEGLTSNFFSIGGGKIFTATTGILPGITRQLVLEAINNLNIPLETRGIKVTKIGKFQEAFITSASRGILPVTVINGIAVGMGKPGELTKQIDQEFSQCLIKALEII